MLLSSDDGVPPDMPRALAWYRKARIRGTLMRNSISAGLCQRARHRGRLRGAFRWYSRAAATRAPEGHADAGEPVEEMTPEQLAAARNKGKAETSR